MPIARITSAVAQRRGNIGMGRNRCQCGAAQRFLGRKFVYYCDDESEDPGTNRKTTKDWMQEKGRRDKQRDPRQVKKCEHGRARHELANHIGITKWLRLDRAAPSSKHRRKSAIEQRRSKDVFEPCAAPHQNPRPQRLEASIDQIEKYGDNREEQQGHQISAAQHAVIDLQHVKRADKRQGIDKKTENRQPGSTQIEQRKPRG